MTMPFLRRPYRQGTHSWIPEQMFVLNDFSGGLNNVDPENTLADNEFTDTMNMRFVGNKLMEKRQGTEMCPNGYSIITYFDKYSPVLGDAKDVMARLYSGGDKIVFCKHNTNENEIVCPIDDAYNVRGVNYNGKYYYVDGKNFYCFDGETYYKIVTEPLAHLTEDVKSADKIIHVDKIPEQVTKGSKVWFSSSILKNFNDSDKKYGIVKTVSSIDAATKTITLDATVGYAIDKGQEGSEVPVVFYEPSEKIYGDEVWDKENHIAYYKPCRQELADTIGGGVSYLPDKPSVITVHANRLFLAGDEKSPNHVYMSRYTSQGPQTLYFPVSTSVAVKPNGKAIVDMFVFDNALIMGRNEDLYVLYGNTPYPSSIDSSGTQFYIKQLDATTGFMGANCGSLINNYYIYLGYDGRFYALNSPTTYVEYLMTRPLPYKCDIYKAPFDFTNALIKRISSVAFRNEVYFSIETSYSSPPSVTIVYNYDNMAYTYYTAPFTGYLYTDGLYLYIANGGLGIAANFNRTGLRKWLPDDDKYYDRNMLGVKYPLKYSPIKARLSTKKYDLNMSAVFKYFKRLILTTRAYKDMNSDIQVDFEVDYYKLTGDENNVVNSNYGTFGVSKWGKAYFGEIDVLKSAWINLDIRGRSIKFTFSSIEEIDETETDEDKYKRNVNVPMRIYDVNVLWGIRDVR